MDTPLDTGAVAGPPSRAATAAPPVLPLVRRLCDVLAAQRISYCHWKSNDALDRSASGDNDLDLLVARAEVDRFTAALHTLGFKEAIAPPDRQMPGVLDYYGHDAASGRLVHVHAHYSLVLGQDLTKNFHLPIERPYLESSTQGDLFRTPSPELELVVFVIRMVVKHLTWDAMLLERRGALSAAERRELAFLQARADRAGVSDVLAAHLPRVDPACFERCLSALDAGASWWTRIVTARDLQRRLSAGTRRGPLGDLGLKVWRRVLWAVQRRFAHRRSRRQLASGGALIAIVGGDGAGKTSALEGLSGWLGKDLDVVTVHLGKPRWSWTTIAVRGLLRIRRNLTGTAFTEDATVLYEEATPPSLGTVHDLALRAACVARDRYRAYARARRMATNGRLVICDRFPLPQLATMEVPRIERLLAGRSPNALLRRLIGLERRYFESMLPPELLFVLRLDPAIAVQRRADERARPVEARNEEIWTADWTGSGAHLIDASQPVRAVLDELKAAVWARL